MSTFDLIWNATLASCASAQPVPVAWPAEASTGVRELPSGTLSLHAEAWRVAAAELRMARIRSAKIDIYTCFAYPAMHGLSPLYAMEFVLLGTRPIVAVLDFACAGNEAEAARAASWLGHVRSRYALPENADDPPDWYCQSRSGADIFLRPQCAADFQTLTAVHLELLSLWCAASCAPGTDRFSAEFAAARASMFAGYKQHHRQHSPGLPLMEKSFGREWTDTFLDQYFFA